MATTYRWPIKTANKLEQASKVLKLYCILHNMNPSETSILVSAYIMVYGLDDNVKQDIIKAGIMGKISSLENEIYKLRKMGILEGVKNKTRISSKIVPATIQALTPQTLILINLDNR